jgi:uncharacterized protein with FMN-binding domain
VKRAPLLVLAGTAAGFIGVLGFHTRSVTLTPSADGTAGNPGGTPAATPSAATPSVSTPSGAGIAGPGTVRSAVGASEQFGYGILDVKVTVSGTRITNVSVPTLQVAELTSQQICDQAIPLLRSEVLTAQSARIDGVSGATYTSEAYAASLQAALDALHMK